MITVAEPIAIRCEGLSWTYQGQAHPALDGISVSIPAGSFVVVTGPSGSGKSTLGLLLAGLLEQGEDGVLEGSLELLPTPTSVGYVMQQPEDQTVMPRLRDDVAFGLENLGVDTSDMDSIIDQALRDVSLQDLGHDNTRILSGGQRQRLSIAGALAMKPGLLVLDEPTSALDAEGHERVRDALRALFHDYGLTIVVIDHNVAPWREIATATITLDGGQIRQPGSSSRKKAFVLPPITPGETVLEAAGLVCSRDGFTGITPALDVHVRSGEVLALTGPNGSGKSTVALTLAGLVTPLHGQVVNPAGLSSLPSRTLAGLVGYVPQNPAVLFGHPTVRQELRETSSSVADQEASLRRWNLQHLADRHPHSLSGGEQRRLALALATVHQPRIVVLDEPTQGLDEGARHEFLRFLHEIRLTGAAIVMATHDRELVSVTHAKELRLDSKSMPQDIPAPRKTPISVANPLAVILAALIPALLLLVTLDVVSATVIVLAAAVCLPLVGVSLTQHFARLIPVVLAAILAGVTISLYGESSGVVYLSWGIIEVSEGSLDLAAATTLRIVALGAPAVLVLSHLDATRLADALAQNARIPEQFVLGGLAGLRLFDVLEGDFAQRKMVERALGRADHPAVLKFFSTVVTALVLAIRRSETLARAMQSRGFASGKRTHYRVSIWKVSDGLWVAAGCAAGALALLVAIWMGEFRVVFG